MSRNTTLVKTERKKLHLKISTETQQWPDVKENNIETRMWANAQRDGRPAEYRWIPLFNAAKFG